MKMIFLDTETTGLDADHHAIWEVAWAGPVGPVRESRLAHNVAGADPRALAVNGYLERAVGPFDLASSLRAEADLRDALDGATLVAANPAFDAAFLRARWGVAPWKYRLLDVEAYAMGAFGWDVPRGLGEIAGELIRRGYEIPLPDHSAAADVAALRACFYALRNIYAERGN